MEIIYREAQPSDAEALIEYMKIVGGETDNLTYDSATFDISAKREERFIERFLRSKRDLMLLAIDAGRIVAYASVESNKIKRFSHRAELSITVLKEYWGRGIGSAVMERLISFAKESGVEVIYLDVRADNVRAISLYEKFGFREICNFEKYFKINGKFFDAKIMILCI